MDKLNIGIVGAVGRGGGFISAINANPNAWVAAMCDVNEDILRSCAGTLGVSEVYTDYREMLDNADLDAVIIGTPMHLHVSQSIEALSRNLHVMSEVTAAVSLEEAQKLVAACKSSKAKYMMAENCCYMKPMVIVREMAKAGLFGDTYYAEGEYFHNARALSEITKWRRKWQTGVDGNTYSTHSLGPIYQWMGDRVVSVSCIGSGRHFQDIRGDNYELEDTVVMLCRMERGGLVELRLDLLSNRPYSIFMRMHGTKGCYESARTPAESPRVCLEITENAEKWIPLSDFEAEFLPCEWNNLPKEAIESGHDGSDYMVVTDFINSIIEDRNPSIGIHEAMDMTLPGLISQQSIINDSKWLVVPNSRDW